MADSQPIQALPTPTEVTTVLVKDPQVQMAWNEVVQQHKGTLFLGYEIGWILIIWIIKAWRLTKAMTLFSRLWTQAWIGIVKFRRAGRRHLLSKMSNSKMLGKRADGMMMDGDAKHVRKCLPYGKA